MSARGVESLVSSYGDQNSLSIHEKYGYHKGEQGYIGGLKRIPFNPNVTIEDEDEGKGHPLQVGRYIEVKSDIMPILVRATAPQRREAANFRADEVVVTLYRNPRKRHPEIRSESRTLVNSNEPTTALKVMQEAEEVLFGAKKS